jgi:hypothetical protein
VKYNEDRLDPASRAVADAARAGVSPTECPDPETFADWASGALRTPERKGLLEHLLTCPKCASVAADAAEVFAPVRALHSAWFGWRGALLSGSGWLGRDHMLSHAFAQHRTRCRSCNWKASRFGFFRQMAVTLFGQPYGPLRAAAVAGVLLVVCYPMLLAPRDHGVRQMAPPRGVGPGETHTKGDGAVSTTRPASPPARAADAMPNPPHDRAPAGAAAPDHADDTMKAEDFVQSLVSPPPADRGRAIQLWEEVRKRQADNPVVLMALKQLYSLEVRDTTSGARQAVWAGKERDVTRRLARLIGDEMGPSAAAAASEPPAAPPPIRALRR